MYFELWLCFQRIVNTFFSAHYYYMQSTFTAGLSQGVDFVLIDSLLKVRIFLSQIPEFSHNLASQMAESGWIFQMIHEIQEVKDTLEQSEVGVSSIAQN